MSAQAWVVVYTTGEYSDRGEEIVRVYASEASANAFASERNAWLRANGLHTDECSASYEDRARLAKDLGMSIDYTGGDFAVHGPFEVFK